MPVPSGAEQEDRGSRFCRPRLRAVISVRPAGTTVCATFHTSAGVTTSVACVEVVTSKRRLSTVTTWALPAQQQTTPAGHG